MPINLKDPNRYKDGLDKFNGVVDEVYFVFQFNDGSYDYVEENHPWKRRWHQTLSGRRPLYKVRCKKRR